MRSFRFSIAGLMGLVLLAAIGSAGVANPSGPWSGVLYLLTRAVLCLAVVGAICRTGSERVWWLGFASFGWIYVGLPFGSFYHSQRLPTHALSEMLGSWIALPPAQNPGVSDEETRELFKVTHSVWAMLAASLGGLLASAIFGNPVTTQQEGSVRALPDGRAPYRRWLLPLAFVLSSLMLFAAILIAGARLEPESWAGLTYLLTWWVLGMTALGSLVGRGRRREFWIGATVIGAGFMILLFDRPSYEDVPIFHPTARFVEALRPPFELVFDRFGADADSIAGKNASVRAALRQRVPMPFPQETAMADVLKYIQQATQDSHGTMIQIYVDPIGLQAAEKSMTSTISGIDLEGIELRTSLRLCLKQLDLAYVVKDGLLFITSAENNDELVTSLHNDPFQIAGHCLLALIAAGLGGLAAPSVCDLARRRGGGVAGR